MKNLIQEFRKKQTVRNAVCALFFGACLTASVKCHAQANQTDGICLTYSQHLQTIKESSGAGFRAGGKYAPCIMLKPEQGLEGCQITEINPCLTYSEQSTKRPGKVFVKDPVTRESLYEQDCELQFGYNPIQLTTPYTVGTKEVLVGYEVDVQAGEYILGIGSRTSRDEDGCWLIFQNQLSNCASYSGMGNWAVDVWLAPNGHDKSTNLVVRSLKPELPYVGRNKNAKAMAIVHNLSSQNISSVDCQMSGITQGSVVKQFSTNIEKGQIDTLMIDVPIAKSGKLDIAITKVNGANKNETTGGTCGFLYYGKQNMPRREHLIERWVAEWAPFVSRLESEIEDVTEFFKGSETKFNLCEFHVNDTYSTDESELFRQNAYNNLPLRKTPTPRLSLNRIPYDDATVTCSCLGKTKNRMEDLEDATYSFYNFSLNLTPTGDPKKLKAKVDITELEKLDFDDIVLTLSLLEDSVLATKQTQAPSDPYYYNNMFVKTINTTQGTPLTFVDGKFTQTFDLEIDEPRSGNINNFKVLATIGRRPGIETPASEKMIFDSRVAAYPVASSIGRAEEQPSVSLTVADKQIKVAGTYDSISVCTAAGQAMNPARPLPAGIYIVKVARGKRVETFKLNIK